MHIHVHRRLKTALFLSVMILAAKGLAAGPAVSLHPAVTPPLIRPQVQVWEPDYAQIDAMHAETDAEARLIKAAQDFMSKEGMDPDSVKVELQPLGDPHRLPGTWHALAQVFVDEDPDGGFSKRLVFEPSFWMNRDVQRFAHHRWTKIMWHEMHHLKAFPVNLRRAPELAKKFPPARPDSSWERAWIGFLEPMEEIAAERTCVERYRAAFGPLSDELLRDSRGDMRKYAALYKVRLDQMLAKAENPAAILQEFPTEMPVDPDGNIL
jgi:hypothetical protein